MSRDALIHALAQHAGQVLTPDVGRAIADFLFPLRPIDCSRWPPAAWAGFSIHAEPWADSVELAQLHAAHAAETGRPDNTDAARLAELHRAGQLLTVAARRDGELVGVLRCFVLRSVRGGELVAQDDFCHIRSAWRGGMLFSRLGAYAENCLRDLGVTWAYALMREANGTPAAGRRRGYERYAIQMRKRLTPPSSERTSP